MIIFSIEKINMTANPPTNQIHTASLNSAGPPRGRDVYGMHDVGSPTGYIVFLPTVNSLIISKCFKFLVAV
ncbi:MAG: hypothetical protein MSIBF_06430 [Candidatus Altiarchaeales archaeon IMC4]|nr:MAG: hypothetical protein MSIBF_06430 [Candidatus Altiarchaeales archaeon IMC4]